MPYLRLLRAQQWIKNVFVFAGLVFGGKLGEPRALLWSLLGFVCLSLVSSSVYIINDVHDREEDRMHPTKRARPLAAGQVGVPAALLLAGGLLAGGLAGSMLLDARLLFLLVVLTYFGLQIAYTFSLKHAVVLDVIAIGLGFVLRAMAGAVLVQVDISHWLVLCTFTLCLFLAFGKRRCELNVLAAAERPDPALHRRTLSAYTPELLNHMTTLTAGIAVVSFMLYASDTRTVKVFGTNYLLYTLPLVVYAIFRFAVLVEHGEVDGPTDVLLRDRPFQLAILGWVGLALLIVYRGRQLQQWLGQAF